MSFTPYSPSDQWHSQLSVADNGQADDSASLFDGTAKYNADNGLYLYERNIATKGGDLVIPLGSPLINLSSYWAFVTADLLWVQADKTGAGKLVWPIPSVFKARMTGVTVRVDGDIGGSTHSNLPATKAKVTVLKRSLTDGASTPLDNTSDDSASVAAYELPHPITVSGLTVDFDNTAEYLLQVEGETGTDSVNYALGILGAYMTLAATS